MVLLPGASPLVYAAAVEPLFVSNRLLGENRFSVRHFTLGPSLGSGLAVVEQPLPGEDEILPDWLFVCGGTPAQYHSDSTLAAWLRVHGERCRALGGLASGSLALAEAGLLDGYRAVLHWWDRHELEAAFPGHSPEPMSCSPSIVTGLPAGVARPLRIC